MQVLAIELWGETLAPILTLFLIIDGLRREKNLLCKIETLSLYKKRTTQWPQRWYSVITKINLAIPYIHTSPPESVSKDYIQDSSNSDLLDA